MSVNFGKKENMIMDDLISVIVPVYNVEKYIRKCIDSILSNTYKNLEIIIVDDGSVDSSSIICDEYKKKDERIVVIHKENGGLSDARNKGIEISNGKYLMFIDSDDYISIDMIETLYKRLISDNTDMSICDYVTIDEKGEMYNSSDIKEDMPDIWDEEYFWESYYRKPSIFHMVAWNKLYKREIFNDIRFDVGKIHEDEFICHKIISKCKSISIINKALYFYLQRSDSIMGKEYSERNFDIVEAIINRARYFHSAGMKKLAEFSLKHSISYATYIYKQLDMKKKENKLRYRNIKKMYNRTYLDLVRKGVSIKFLFNGFTFFMGQVAYRIAHLYKKIL